MLKTDVECGLKVKTIESFGPSFYAYKHNDKNRKPNSVGRVLLDVIGTNKTCWWIRLDDQIDGSAIYYVDEFNPINAHESINKFIGTSYPLPSIGRVLFSDEETTIPCVLLDDGCSTQEQHEHMLKSIRMLHPDMEIVTSGKWTPLGPPIGTALAQYFLNLNSKRK